MRKTVFIVVVIVVACALLVAFTRSRGSGKGGDTNATGAMQGGRGGRGGMGPQIIPVAVAPAVKQDMPVYVTGLGSVEAFYTVTIKTRVDGEVLKVYFKEGQDVKQGEPLVEIDPRPYQVALEQAQATLLKDQAQLKIAQRNFERYSGLFKQGVVSQQDVDTQESTYGALVGQVKADQSAVDNAKLNLVYCHITSPIAGRVGLRIVDPGNMVHASDATGLIVITQLHPIAATFTIPEDSLPSVIHAEHQQTKPLEVDVFSRDNQTKLAMGKLTTINNQIDQTTGTVKLKAVFDNTEGLLWPNQFVNARLLLDVKKDVVVIPAAAIERGVQGTFVFVVGQDNKAQVRPVKVGVANGDSLEIASGLQPGEQVVTDGQDKLQSGSQVQPHMANGGNAGGQNQHTAQIPVGM